MAKYDILTTTGNVRGTASSKTALTGVLNTIGLSNVLAVQLTGEIDSFSFNGCTNLANVDISKLKVTDIRLENAFSGCQSLKSIIGLSTLNVSNIINFNGMFAYCASLQTLDLSKWNLLPDVVEQMQNMFRSCTNLEHIWIGDNFNVNPNLANTSSMFADCPKLPNFDPSQIDGSMISTYTERYTGEAYIQLYSKVSNIVRKAFPYINAATDTNLGGVKIWTGTQTEYDDLDATDPDTLYLVEDEGPAPVGISIEVVQTLPTTDISTSTIYLVPKQDTEQDNVYDEYVYVNNNWELIGSTAVDLTDYYTKDEIDDALDTKADAADLSTVATSGSYNDLTDKPTIPVVPTLATVATTGDYEDLINKPVIPAGIEYEVVEVI